MSRLDQISDWDEHAAKVNFRIAALARGRALSATLNINIEEIIYGKSLEET